MKTYLEQLFPKGSAASRQDSPVTDAAAGDVNWCVRLHCLTHSSYSHFRWLDLAAI